MTVYQLLWQLIKHALHGRGRDEVYLHITDDPADLEQMRLLSGQLEDLTWTDNRDAFVVLSATDRDGLS